MATDNSIIIELSEEHTQKLAEIFAAKSDSTQSRYESDVVVYATERLESMIDSEHKAMLEALQKKAASDAKRVGLAFGKSSPKQQAALLKALGIDLSALKPEVVNPQA